MRSLSAAVRRNWISILTVIFGLALWEVISWTIPPSQLSSSSKVPSLEYVFTEALLGMADYWKFDLWAPVPEKGGAQTALGAVLAIIYHSAMTLFRLTVGLIVGAVLGTVIGLLLSASETLRSIAGAPLHFLRMTPLLAMIPAFQFWFGATDLSAIIFVAYGTSIPFILGAINAVANVPKRYMESARTLGASRGSVYRMVVLPAILPEMFSTVIVALGLAWSAVIGAEYIGVQSGLGRIVIWSDYFSNTRRMIIITFLITAYAGVSFALINIVRQRALGWMKP